MTGDIEIDTQLLVLLIVGLTSPSYVGRHKRLDSYTRNDFDLLQRMIWAAPRLLVTPNVLTETSNLIRHIEEPARRNIMSSFQSFIADANERHVPSSRAAARKEFVRLGLTDVVLLETPTPDATLLTVDFDLYLAAQHAGRRVVNFTHHRQFNL